MEKRILVAGCSHYLREYITNGLYYISNEYYLRMLYKKYEVYNLSKKNLSSSEALLLIKAFLKVDSFNACVISLGEGDYALNKTKEEFKRNLMERDFDEEFLSIFLDYNGQNNSLVEYLLLNYSIDEINKIINQKWVSVYISSVFILFEITFKSYNNIVLISLIFYLTNLFPP